MHKNVFAYTSSVASYPEYLSVNLEDDGSVTITVRSPPSLDVTQCDFPPLAVCGPTAKMVLPRDKLDDLITSLRIFANNLKIMET